MNRLVRCHREWLILINKIVSFDASGRGRSRFCLSRVPVAARRFEFVCASMTMRMWSVDERILIHP